MKRLNTLIGDHIYGENEEEMAETVGKLLRAKGLTLAVAESCTGGYLSHLITSIPGCGDYYRGSLVSYDNALKTDILEVPSSLLERVGAVSEDVVKAMAEGVREKFTSDIGIATSGIAGPSGGTPDKPVGTIWVACALAGQTRAWKLQLGKDRHHNIEMTAVLLLERLRRQLLGIGQNH